MFNFVVSVPLLHVLALHARVLASWPASITFQQLCGLRASSSSAQAIAAVEKEVPLLIRDPMALLLQFVLLLPLQLDQSKYRFSFLYIFLNECSLRLNYSRCCLYRVFHTWFLCKKIPTT